MARTKGNKKQADAILTADWHIRADVPVCRTDDFLAAQWRKLEFIFNLADDHDCSILIAGDIGHRPQWPCWVLREFFNIWTKQPIRQIYMAMGQHDLPGHRLDRFDFSALGALAAGQPNYIHGGGPLSGKVGDGSGPMVHSSSYGSLWPVMRGPDLHRVNILLAHEMVIEDKPLWPGQQAHTGQWYLKKFPDFKLIVTGDNHLPFVAEREGRLLVNPGSMMRMTADQADHRPRVYLWYADTNTVEPVYLPIEKGVVSRAHIEHGEERDKRMEAFIERAGEQYDVGLSFTDNLQRFFDANPRTRRAIREKVWAAVEGEK